MILKITRPSDLVGTKTSLAQEPESAGNPEDQDPAMRAALVNDRPTASATLAILGVRLSN